MRAAASFHHLLILFTLTYLICWINAVPVSRTRSLAVGSQVYPVSENTHLANTAEEIISFDKVEEVIKRMDVELHDYPGSGANNRHTPNPKP